MTKKNHVLLPSYPFLYIVPTTLICFSRYDCEKLTPEHNVIKQQIFMFMNFVVQKFRKDTEGMACLCSIMSHVSVGRLKGWALESSDGDFTQKSGGGCWPGGALPFHIGFSVQRLYKLIWASSLHGGWFCQSELPKQRELG